MVDTTPDILRQDAVARTPISQPVPGKAYEHAQYGYVRVKRVEDGMVVFRRQTPTGKKYTINNRQQPVDEFAKYAIDP